MNQNGLKNHPVYNLTVKAFSLLAVAIIVYTVVAHLLISNGTSQPESDEAQAALKLMTLRTLQMSIGLLIGACILFVGVLTCWFGIAAELRAERKKSKAAIGIPKAASMLFVCGTVVIVVALLQRVDGERNGENAAKKGESAASTANEKDAHNP